jgi:AcrR family transcriptional regulator
VTAAEARVNKRQLQAAATREQLLAAARDVFEERGFAATSVGAITDRACTAHGTFYLYFKNKEDAFCHVIAAVTATLEDEVVAPWGASPQRAIEAGMRGFLRAFAEHRGLWRALLEGMLQSAKVEQVWLELRRDLIDRLARTVATQQAAGRVRDLDPVLVAHAMGAMTEWLAFCHVVLAEPASETDPERLAAVLSDLWLHAIYGVTPQPAEPAHAG